jgi:hypothetical protein
LDRSRFLCSVSLTAGQSDFSSHEPKRRLSHSSGSFIPQQALRPDPVLHHCCPMFLTLPPPPCVSVLPPEPCRPDFDSCSRCPDFIPGSLLCHCCSHPGLIFCFISWCRRPGVCITMTGFLRLRFCQRAGPICSAAGSSLASTVCATMASAFHSV